MSTELANQQMCICLRGDFEVWVDKDRAEKLQNLLENNTGRQYIQMDDRTINTADIVAILRPQDMEDRTRRKNGERKCKYGEWHEARGICECGKNKIVNPDLHILDDAQWEKTKIIKDQLKDKLTFNKVDNHCA
ncbi:MAG: hypothetical protein WC805_03830 [Patescibacteria group bacterium]|jgi:hypothetical protein